MSNNKQSSSIDFFWNQLPEILPFTVNTEIALKLLEAFEQAKAMHKEEIINANFDAQPFREYTMTDSRKISEQYYKEKFDK